MLNHLGGGPGGIEHFFFQRFTGPMTAWWKTLGSPLLTPEVQKKFIDSVHDEAGSRGIEKLEGERHDVLLGFSNCAVRRWSLAKRLHLSNGDGVVISRNGSSGQVGGSVGTS